MTALCWFRNDLRLDDHEALVEALSRHDGRVACVYCVDPRQFEAIEVGGRALPKIGPYRARFLIETLTDLRQRLEGAGGELIVRLGRPELELPRLAEELGAEEVVFSEEVTSEELEIERAVQSALSERGVKTRSSWGATLYHIEELPWEIEQLPEVFTPFRKQLESSARAREPLEAPTHFEPVGSQVSCGEIPTLEALGYDPAEAEVDPRGVLAFPGGESAGRARLEAYFFEADALRRYKETRNGLIGPNYSSKLSAYLALGCLSPRRVYAEIKRYERERVSNESTYWLVFELLWRDFFRFLAFKRGPTPVRA